VYDEVRTLALPDEVRVVGRIPRQDDGPPGMVDPVAESGVAVFMVNREGGYLHAVALEDRTLADLVHADRQVLQLVEGVDPMIKVVREHGAHALDHARGAPRTPCFERPLAPEQEPRGHPQGRQALIVVVVQVSEEDRRDVPGIDTALIEALHHAPAGIEEELLLACNDQGRVALSMGRQFGPACAEEMDTHRGFERQRRSHSHEQGHQHERPSHP
jgi:hypothetical protein